MPRSRIIKTLFRKLIFPIYWKMYSLIELNWNLKFIPSPFALIWKGDIHLIPNIIAFNISVKDKSFCFEIWDIWLKSENFSRSPFRVESRTKSEWSSGRETHSVLAIPGICRDIPDTNLSAVMTRVSWNKNGIFVCSLHSFCKNYNVV